LIGDNPGAKLNYLKTISSQTRIITIRRQACAKSIDVDLLLRF